MLKNLLLIFSVSLLSIPAYATATYECDGVDNPSVEIRYNVGWGMPGWLQAVPAQGDIIRTGYDSTNKIIKYWSDEDQVLIDVQDERGQPLLKLQTIRKGDVEVGIATFGSKNYAVLCKQIG